ncbi:hypothetical protein [Aeromonas hydrophila]|uniref:hypothetical protein n=1 Tax=Aeromonas hydrophila TaxID=644 RepID=UPI00080AA232|nr:hypothetical protein [Aeromonas hydrophila]ANT70168.1 hypothetical protein TK34_22050 [Aeromonas hydrophila]
MQSQLSLRDVVKDIEFIYTRATDNQPAKFELPPNIADVEAVSGAPDIMSAWIVYQFAIPDKYQGELRHIRKQFISAMEKRRHDRRA